MPVNIKPPIKRKLSHARRFAPHTKAVGDAIMTTPSHPLLSVQSAKETRLERTGQPETEASEIGPIRGPKETKEKKIETLF